MQDECLIHNHQNAIWVCPHIVSSSFTAPETRAGDCEPGASSCASSARRNLSDHRSQLRFVREAVRYVDGIQLVKDGDHTAHLWLSAWEETAHGRKAPADSQTKRIRQITHSSRCFIVRDQALSCRTFLSFSCAVSVPCRLKSLLLNLK